MRVTTWAAPGERSGFPVGARPVANGVSGAVVVVTGVGSTAGPAIVRHLARQGAFVVAVDTEDSRVTPLVRRVRADGGRCAGRTVDLVDDAATRAWAQSLLSQCGRVDGLVHLTGTADGMPDIDAGPSDWEWLQSLVLRTLVNASLALRDGLAASERGRLVLVSALQAGRPTARNAFYAAAQAAAEAWVLAAADDLRGTRAAATVLSLRRVLGPASRERTPDVRLPGQVPADEVAARVADLWSAPAHEVNGARLRLQ